MKSTPAIASFALLTASLILMPASEAISIAGQSRRSQDVEAAQVRIEGFGVACAVELDASPAGKTDSEGQALLDGIKPGDHYVHVACPGQAEQAFFISPKEGERIDLRPRTGDVEPLGPDSAAAHHELSSLVQKAVQARQAGHSEEAIADLRRAAELDPENPDLHRELGITFLLMKDWERARVEYLEAIKHDPTEAESHNGLGYALDKLGETEAAANEFRTATRLDPDDDTYREHYVEALAELEARKEKEKKKR